MRPLAVARFDAGRGVGLGHLVRCRAVLAQLARLGWETAVATTREAVDLVPELAPQALVVDHDDAGAMRARWPGGCDLLIVDHYGRNADFEQPLRGWARAILVIDDLADRAHAADLLLDQTPGRAAADYAGLVPPHCRGLFGGDYALLRPQFQAARTRALPRRDGRPVGRLLIALGGADADDWTSRALAATVAAGYAGEIDAVLGAAAPHGDRVAAAVAAIGPRARLHRDVADMAGLMAGCDLAIGAAGISSWERCALGLPSVAVVVADNQRACAAALAAAGAAIVADGETLAQALAATLDDAAARRAMAAAGPALCDGRGLQRLALAMLAPVAGSGSTVTLRLARPDDSARMLAWQALPGVRRYARTPAVPGRSEHEAWMARVLADPARWLMLIELDGRPVGILRLDEVAWRQFEVSILVDPACHGRGVASRALALAARLCRGAILLAEVDPANAPSRALFARAGYVMVDERHWRWTAA